MNCFQFITKPITLIYASTNWQTRGIAQKPSKSNKLNKFFAQPAGSLKETDTSFDRRFRDFLSDRG